MDTDLTDFDKVCDLAPFMICNIFSSIALLRISTESQIERTIKLLISDAKESFHTSTLVSKSISILLQNGYIDEYEASFSSALFTLTQKGKGVFVNERFSQTLNLHSFFTVDFTHLISIDKFESDITEQYILINDALLNICSEYLDGASLFSAEYLHQKNNNIITVSIPDRLSIIPGIILKFQNKNLQNILRQNNNDYNFVVTRSADEIKTLQLTFGDTWGNSILLLVGDNLKSYNYEGEIQLQEIFNTRKKLDGSQKKYHEDILNDFFMAFKAQPGK